jgi:hypothetical protein
MSVTTFALTSIFAQIVTDRSRRISRTACTAQETNIRVKIFHFQHITEKYLNHKDDVLFCSKNEIQFAFLILLIYGINFFHAINLKEQFFQQFTNSGHSKTIELNIFLSKFIFIMQLYNIGVSNGHFASPMSLDDVK